MKRSHMAISGFVILAALAAAAQSGGQESFELMKTLAGSWEGKGSEGGQVRVRYRMTAEWHFLVGGKEMVERFDLEKKG